jgi:hypothetical protein
MKNRRHYINKAGVKPIETFEIPSSEEMMEDVMGTKVLYNWLYQQEEKDYYLDTKVSDLFPEFAEQEALFVEY